MQRTKRGANFNAEIFQHQFAYLIAVDPVGDHHPQHVIHFVPQIAKGLEPHRLDALQQRIAVQFVAGDAVVESLLEDQARALPGSEQRRGRFGMVVKALRPPVIHHHAEIEIVGVDHLVDAIVMGIGADPLLNAAAAADDLFHPRAEGDGRGAGRTAQALLHPGGHRVQLPGVGFQRVTAERCGGVGIEQHIVTTANLPQLRQRLQHGGGGIALHGEQQARPHALDRILNLIRRKDLTPRHLDGVHLCPAATRDLAQQMTKPAEHRHQHLVTGTDRRQQNRFDPGARGAVDQHRPAIFGAKHAAVQRHDFIHVVGHRRIVLANQLARHGAQHARVGIDRPRPHQQALRRVNLRKLSDIHLPFLTLVKTAHRGDKLFQFAGLRAGEQRFAVALLPDASLMHKHHAVAHFAGKIHFMGDEDQRHTFRRQLLQHLQHFTHQFRVECRGDFVTE